MSNTIWSLNDITTEHPVEPPIGIIYSEPGRGKTHFACNIPDHVMIRTGDGLGSLRPNAFPKAKDFIEVMSQMTFLLKEEHNFKTLVIDTLTMLEALIWKHAVLDWNNTFPSKQIKSITEPEFGKGYAHCMFFWEKFVDLAERLRDEKNMAIIMLAHSEDKDKSDAVNDKTYKKIGVKIHKTPQKLFIEKCDIIALLMQQTNIITEKGSFGGEGESRINTSGIRKLCVSTHPAYEAKNRYNLPAEIIPANWDKLMELITQSIKEGRDVSIHQSNVDANLLDDEDEGEGSQIQSDQEETIQPA